MERVREFVWPDSARQRSIEVPYTHELRVWEAGELQTQDYKDNAEAIEAFSAQVDAWLEQGALELGPWLRYVHAKKPAIAIRLPATEVLWTRKKGKPSAQHFETMRDVCVAANAWLKKARAQGYTLAPFPAWEDVEKPGKPWVESETARHRGFHHEDDPSLELGPELHLHEDGAISNALIQVGSQAQGARWAFRRSGALGYIDLCHRDKGRGALFLFDEQGWVLTSLKRIGARRNECLVVCGEDGTLEMFLPEGTDEQGAPLIREQYHEDHIRVCHFVDGALVSETKKTPDGKLMRQEETSADGTKTVSVYYADGETLSKRYQERAGKFVGEFIVAWDTGEVAKRFRFDPEPTPERSPPVLEFVPTSKRFKTTRRLRVPYGQELESWAGKKKSRKTFASHEAACAGAMALMKQWHGKGFIEQGPWTVWENEARERRRVRLPVLSTLEQGVSEQGAWCDESVSYETHREAVLAYDEAARALQGAGFELLIPPEHGGWPVPSADFAQFIFTPREDEDGMVQRRVHIRRAALSEEITFGPQREVFEQGKIIDVTYLYESLFGWRMAYVDGKLSAAQPLLDGEAAGRVFSFDEHGRIDSTMLRLDTSTAQVVSASQGANSVESSSLSGQEGQQLTSYHDSHPDQVYARGMLDADGERDGEWTFQRVGGSLERKVLFEHGRVASDSRFDEQGALISQEWSGSKQGMRTTILPYKVLEYSRRCEREQGRVLGEEARVWEDEAGRLAYADCPAWGKHYHYPAHVFGPTPQQGSWDEDFGKVRELSQGEQTRENWLSLCEALEGMYRQDQQRWLEEILPYARQTCAPWPSRLRMAPMLWINKLIAHALPWQILELVSALSFTPALTEHYLDARAPMLLHWLAGLPEDAPALEGLHLSYTHDAIRALRAAQDQEPEERFHCVFPDQPTFHYEGGVLESVLSSPLARALRVLDLSFETPPWDYYSSWQGPTDGCTASLERVAPLIQDPDALEVLNLQGSSIERMSASPPQLKGVRVFNVSEANPLGDVHLGYVAKVLPNLEELAMVPHCIGWLLGSPYPEDEEVASNIDSYWSVYEFNFRDMELSASGLSKTLKKWPLKRLILQDYYEGVGAIQRVLARFPEVQVDYASAHGGYMANAPSSDWGEHFESS